MGEREQRERDKGGVYRVREKEGGRYSEERLRVMGRESLGEGTGRERQKESRRVLWDEKRGSGINKRGEIQLVRVRRE